MSQYNKTLLNNLIFCVENNYYTVWKKKFSKLGNTTAHSLG